MEKKLVVPKGMLEAAYEAGLPMDHPTFSWDETDEHTREFYRRIVEAALRWLSEHPIVPTMEQATEMSDSGHPCVLDGVWYATEWQRRMFLAPPEPESKWTGESRHLNWLKLMVDPDGGFYFDKPAKEAVQWAIEQIEGKSPEPEVPEAIKEMLALRPHALLPDNCIEAYNENIIEAYRRGKAAK